MAFEDLFQEHEILYSGNSLTLGKIHWNILKADTEFERRSKTETPDDDFKEFRQAEESFTEFGKEAYGHEIHWWVYKQETDFEDLKSRTESTLNSLQKLKEDAVDLDQSFIPADYNELISRIKTFTDEHETEINNLYEYVIFLRNKDVLAPTILFSFDVWGSTRLSDRTIKITKDDIDEDLDRVKLCTDIVLGIRYGCYPTISSVHSDMDYELYSRLDPEEYQKGHTVDKRELLIRISRLVLGELEIYFENIRNSLRMILKEIENFNSETSPIVRTIDYGNRIKDKIRFCLVQCDFSVEELPRSELFGYSVVDESEVKAKIFSALEIGKENNIDVICFPELSFKQSWIDEIQKKYDEMIIVGGSYYDGGYNVCPILIGSVLHEPPYAKCYPSPGEKAIEIGREMEKGKLVYNFQTKCGNFSVLNCIDYPHLSNRVINDGKIKLDFIINPCYDSNIKRFESQCNSDCENFNITVIRVNKAGEKFGGSGIFCKEHRSIISRFESGGWRDPDDQEYQLIRLKKEQMVIADVDICNVPTVALPTGYSPRVSVIAEYQFLDGVWQKST